MILKFYKPYTPGLRQKSSNNFSFLSKIKPLKKLTFFNLRSKGRNNSGKITTRHKGGGHKRLYRIIDFKRNKFNIYGIVSTIEYDPNRNTFISLINYEDGTKKYILNIDNLKIGDKIYSSDITEIKVGNSLLLKNIPLGTNVHNIELIPGKGGQICRAAGTFGKIIAKENKYVIIRLCSKEIRLFRNDCRATIGKLSNSEIYTIKIGKAGRNRWLGIRPTVRGSAMNPIDHPHGGGEGKSPIGRKRPLTPWGKPALGLKTRSPKNKSNKYIIHLN